MVKCPICNSLAKTEELSDKRCYRVTCDRCGKFELKFEALTMFNRSDEPTKIQSVSFWIKQHELKNEYIDLDSEKIRNLLIPFVPLKPREQAERFLIWLGSQLISPDEPIVVNSEKLISIIGAFNRVGVLYIYNYLKDKGNFNSSEIFSTDQGTFDIYIILSVFGWDQYYDLQKSNKDSRLAFMALQFNNAILQDIYTDIIVPAVKETGFEIRKLDDVKRAGLIDDKLRVEIRRSKFVLADLTDENRGAYWEAGFAEGLGIPVIYLCEFEKFEKEKPHFDTNHYLIVKWHKEKNCWEEFAEELKAIIRETLPNETLMED